jgi:tripartite-type tricarboxylate transporter receptor subunit TctC
LTSTLTHIQQGRLRVLAVASNQRSPLYPSAPTLVEQGVDGVSGSAWFGFLAPARLHPTLVGAIHKAITGVLADARVTQVLAGVGLQAMPSTTPQEFSGFIEAEVRKWNAVIKDSNIKVE